VIRYMLVSAAAKGFSMSSGSRGLYRQVGNVVETSRRLRSGLPERYLDRAIALSALCATHRPVADGDRVLELGTGWVHWESMVVRLVAEVEPTMLDIVDDRLWKVYLNYLTGLRASLDRLVLPAGRQDAAAALLDSVLRAGSFEDAYEALGADYRVEPSGSLASFETGSYALVMSADTLEHVQRPILPELVAETYRLLRPGGYAIHQIDLADHLSYFDPKMSPKYYLKHAPEVWDRYFNSTVQYINRVQRPAWDSLFEKAGFEILQREVVSEPLRGVTAHQSYKALSQADLEASLLRYVLRKPPLRDSPPATD
jgi:SAM-dependent methyltransferase